MKALIVGLTLLATIITIAPQQQAQAQAQAHGGFYGGGYYRRPIIVERPMIYGPGYGYNNNSGMLAALVTAGTMAYEAHQQQLQQQAMMYQQQMAMQPQPLPPQCIVTQNGMYYNICH